MSYPIPLSRFLKKVALAIEKRGLPTTQRQKLMLGLIGVAPLYSDFGRLDLWDEALRAIYEPPDGTDMSELLNALHDMAELNLYCAFQGEKTLAAYRTINERFRGLGLPAPDGFYFPDW